MFGLFNRSLNPNPGGGNSKPSLDAIRFDTTGFVDRGESEPGKVHIWQTPEGDGLGVYFFPLPPDLPARAASVGELAASYDRLLETCGGKMIEIAVISVGGCPTIRTIISAPQQPSGRIYVGSLTVPFRDFSFVIKCQCFEGGPTGLKEAILLDRHMAANEPMQVNGGRFDIPGWNPDDEQHDAEFPNHPVARTRRVMSHVTGSLRVAKAVMGLPRFTLPR